MLLSIMYLVCTVTILQVIGPYNCLTHLESSGQHIQAVLDF